MADVTIGRARVQKNNWQELVYKQNPQKKSLDCCSLKARQIKQIKQVEQTDETGKTDKRGR